MKPLFWIDLEMTGLDEVSDKILEVAVIITDINLKHLEQYHRVVFQPQEVVDGMNDWCKKTHGDSGLTAAIPTGTPLETVEKELLELIGRHYGGKDRVVLAGNSVGNDKRFIDRYMPDFAKRLHYRLIDISSFKEIYREKYNLSFAKQNSHRAVDDIVESIKELEYYLSFIKIPETPSK
ncbi:MAG: oligoribonuclease [Methylotenera sp.]|nr:oligoribonuclease [Oligoflexia bacterium]